LHERGGESDEGEGNVQATKLDGRVVAVTGAARGIGLATARALHDAGARVAIGDIDQSAAQAAAAAIGAGAVAGRVDVTDGASYDEFLDLAETQLGPLSVLVNNAGIMPIGPMVAEAQEVARRVLEINVLGYLTGMKLSIPRMQAHGGGHVVNVASVAGRSPVPGAVSYSASKAAVLAMTESARVEHAGRGIRFSCILPASTRTDLVAGTRTARFVPLVEPEDVAKAVVRAVVRARADVYVPRSAGVILKLQALTGRGLRDRLNRMLGIDRLMLDFDEAARADYDARISGAPRAM
jgi:NAD(P)-dependent dehydrogenase (short-subunit alcohol dehydrogenase family)